MKVALTGLSNSWTRTKSKIRFPQTPPARDNETKEKKPPRYFDKAYQERIVLTDGTVAHLRLVQSTDHDIWVNAFKRLSMDSRYLRFCAPKKKLSEDEIRYFTTVDQEQHFALVAVKGEVNEDSRVGLGVARFICAPEDPTRAEAAVTVTDDAQHRGLGSLLLLRLAAAARERGVEKFDANVLAANRQILRLIDEFSSSNSDLEQYKGEFFLTTKIPPVAPDETWDHMHQDMYFPEFAYS
eukprot:CAMPEP_0197445660 /NCGR_PEP_ID=MMETSP1175-20131217/10822_1 /TAXON_ID=1003142 /ORGANISM="Triceratium dubium, Strain CCMP147" /LENGTH=239 /DNA_ID=CAMNT_0042976653 /DNA_START=339 /DNA_END=1058 /DNA_ORIENTATION=+